MRFAQPSALSRFSALTRDWFTSTFAAPTAAQASAWAAIADGDNTLVIAPTGSGKTLAAFLWALDSLAGSEPMSERPAATRVCFVSGVLPTAPVSAVADPRRLVTRARDMLWVNRFRWNRCTTGDTRAGRRLWVYGRAGQGCRRCGTLIAYDTTDERVRYWCPACQR